MSQDKTDEQLRVCREAFEVWIGEIGLSGYLSRDSRDIYAAPTVSDYWEAWEASWNISADTRADSGEAVAWMTHHDAPMVFTYRGEAAEYCNDDEQPIPLFTHQRATAVDVNAAYTRGRSDGWDACNSDENRDASRWRQFVEMIDQDKVPGGFTVYYAMEKSTDQLCYFDCVTELVDAAIASREGEGK